MTRMATALRKLQQHLAERLHLVQRRRTPEQSGYIYYGHLARRTWRAARAISRRLRVTRPPRRRSRKR